VRMGASDKTPVPGSMAFIVRQVVGVHPGLTVRRTSIGQEMGQPMHMFGLHVDRDWRFCKGDFLGFYTGEWKPKKDDVQYKGKNEYVMDLDAWLIRPK
jgi:hypothetical protein